MIGHSASAGSHAHAHFVTVTTSRKGRFLLAGHHRRLGRLFLISRYSLEGVNACETV